jgi:hypothetical protein
MLKQRSCRVEIRDAVTLKTTSNDQEHTAAWVSAKMDVGEIRCHPLVHGAM